MIGYADIAQSLCFVSMVVGAGGMAPFMGCSSDEDPIEFADSGDAIDSAQDSGTSGDSQSPMDGVNQDSSDVDTESASCPGGFLCPCSSNGDCRDQMCIEGTSGKICTRICNVNCPSGFDCTITTLGGAEPLSICVPHESPLCGPGVCAIDGRCVAAEALNPDNVCERCRPEISTERWSTSAGACDDGDPCTAKDACVDGTCVGEPGACAPAATVAGCESMEPDPIRPGFMICSFRTPGSYTLTISGATVMIEATLVGGGGGSMGHASASSGGGGAGGYKHSDAREYGVGSYTIVVGQGGAGAGNGVDSSFTSGRTFDELIAHGGGYGGSAVTDYVSGNGGSGGGGGPKPSGPAGLGIPGEGNKGGDGMSAANNSPGGGGGAGSEGKPGTGTHSGDGGACIQDPITKLWMAGGGGGGSDSATVVPGVAPCECGGTGNRVPASGGNGVNGRGCGAGGGGAATKGGDGAVYLRFQLN